MARSFGFKSASSASPTTKLPPLPKFGDEEEQAEKSFGRQSSDSDGGDGLADLPSEAVARKVSTKDAWFGDGDSSGGGGDGGFIRGISGESSGGFIRGISGESSGGFIRGISGGSMVSAKSMIRGVMDGTSGFIRGVSGGSCVSESPGLAGAFSSQESGACTKPRDGRGGFLALPMPWIRGVSASSAATKMDSIPSEVSAKESLSMSTDQSRRGLFFRRAAPCGTGGSTGRPGMTWMGTNKSACSQTASAASSAASREKKSKWSLFRRPAPSKSWSSVAPCEGGGAQVPAS